MREIIGELAHQGFLVLAAPWARKRPHPKSNAFLSSSKRRFIAVFESAIAEVYRGFVMAQEQALADLLPCLKVGS